MIAWIIVLLQPARTLRIADNSVEIHDPSCSEELVTMFQN
jgi:hypothetical protein